LQGRPKQIMNITSFRESTIKGTIELDKPIRGLGRVTDVYGKQWDVNAIFLDYVAACPVNQLHPYFSDTSGRHYNGLISQVWEPYTINVIGS